MLFNIHSSKCTCNHSQSHYEDESMMEMSVRYLLRLTRMSSMSKCQERELHTGQHVFISPLNKQSRYALEACPVGGVRCSDAGRRRGLSIRQSPDRSTDGYHMSLVKRDPLISNSHLNVEALSQEVSNALGATQWTCDPHTERYSESQKPLGEASNVSDSRPSDAASVRCSQPSKSTFTPLLTSLLTRRSNSDWPASDVCPSTHTPMLVTEEQHLATTH